MALADEDEEAGCAAVAAGAPVFPAPGAAAVLGAVAAAAAATGAGADAAAPAAVAAATSWLWLTTWREGTMLASCLSCCSVLIGACADSVAMCGFAGIATTTRGITAEAKVEAEAEG